MEHKLKHKLIGRMAAVAALCFVIALISDAHGQPGTQSTLPDVASMFMGKWQGEGKNAEGPFLSDLTFAWTLDRNFIEVANYIVANDKREKFAITFYGWQPVLGQLVFWAFDKDGTINEGVAEIKENELRHQWRAFRREGEIREMRSSLALQDKDHLVFRLDDNRGMEIFSMTYTRVKE